MKFGEKVRSLRRAKNMTQEELAKAIGYTNRGSICGIESGRSDPAWDIVPKLAEALSVPVSELLSEDPNDKESLETYKMLACLMRCDKQTIEIVKKIIDYK